MADDSGTPQLRVNSQVTIPLAELRFRFSRSSGPGGQNVNKLETRVELLFDLEASPSLTAEQRLRVRERLSSHLDAAGMLHLFVSDTRSQLQNRRLAILRFEHKLRAALRVSRPRLASRPSAGAVQARLDDKRHRAGVKEQRRVEGDSEDGGDKEGGGTG